MSNADSVSTFIIPPITSEWTTGRRVVRPNGRDSGTIVESGNRIKVKWDSGRTSYYEFGKPAFILLGKPE